MAVNWDLYNKRLNINGSTTRERDLNYIKQNINNKLPNSLSYKSVLINDIPQNIEILKSNSTSKNTTKKQINSLPNETFSCGDYVKYKNATYLIIDVDVDDEVYTTGRIELCNWLLKFQSPTGTILSYPCITSTKSFNQDENKVITLPSNQKSILLPYDDNTALLATGRRMYVDKRTNPTPYEIIGDVDTTTYNYGDKGLIYFIMEQSSKEITNDRPDLGICNYFEPTTEPKPPVEGYSVTVSTTGDLIAGSSIFRTFTPILKDNTGTVVEFTSIPTWTFDYGGMSPTDFTITYDGNLCKIKVVENYDYVGKTLRVICTTVDGLYSGYVDVLIMM